ncbi:MAG: MBL fold metallo-hydrolase [Acholeplasmataceae bacterium]|nr:MAG: MBL fold metallo-hydrolase [Acholeplasmataceae bacterium]
MLIVFLGYTWCLRKQLPLIWLSVLASLIFVRFTLFIQHPVPERIDAKVKVVNIETLSFQDRLTIRHEGGLYHVRRPHGAHALGDALFLRGQTRLYRRQTVPFGFDAHTFHLAKGVRGRMVIDEVTHVTTGFSLWQPRQTWIERFDDLASKDYLQAFIFGERAFDHEQQAVFRATGVLYLFSVSGLHLYVLMGIVRRMLFVLDVPTHLQTIIMLLFFGVCLYLQAFSIAVVRLFLKFVFDGLNRRFEWGYVRLDGLFVVFYVMLLVNIAWLFHLGFLLSFLILLALTLTESSYEHHEGYMKGLRIVIIVQLTALPFFLRVAPLSWVLMPVFIWWLTRPLFLGALIVGVMPAFDQPYHRLTVLFETFIQALEQRHVVFELPALPLVLMITYGVMLAFLLMSERPLVFIRRLALLAGVFVLALVYHLHPHDVKVYVLDVGQGDSIVIQSRTCNVVIDAYVGVVSFLNNHGIHRLDYLVLTHSHMDHIREADDVLGRIRTDRLVLSPYDDYPVSHVHVTRPAAGTLLHCHPFVFHVLGPLQDYGSPNNNSLVLQVNLSGTIFMFTGDMEMEAEHDLVDHYGIRLKSDVLKVGHHGSRTSTTSRFLEHVDPTVAVISLGFENRHRFPHDCVMARLAGHGALIYRTDTMGTVLFSRLKKREKWVLYLPFDA